MRVTKDILTRRLAFLAKEIGVPCEIDYYAIGGGYRVDVRGHSSPFGLSRVPAAEMLDRINIAIQTAQLLETLNAARQAPHKGKTT